MAIQLLVKPGHDLICQPAKACELRFAVSSHGAVAHRRQQRTCAPESMKAFCGKPFTSMFTYLQGRKSC